LGEVINLHKKSKWNFSSFLPEGLLSHFNIVDFKELGNLQSKKDCFYIYLDEKNILPKDFDSNEFESKGFYERALIQDFPGESCLFRYQKTKMAQ
jgi:hypothetical protein